MSCSPISLNNNGLHKSTEGGHNYHIFMFVYHCAVC